MGEAELKLAAHTLRNDLLMGQEPKFGKCHCLIKVTRVLPQVLVSGV